MIRVLLIDDDRELCHMLSRYLQAEGFECLCRHDGDSGLDLALKESFDALVVDVMMPRLNGFELVRRLRGRRNTPVLMLTARGEDVDSILGLEIGADDYLTKPCNPKVLVARLRAVLRRGPAKTDQTILKVDSITLHPGTRAIQVNDLPIELTGAEFNLLQVLMRHAGEVVSKEHLCRQGLGRDLSSFDRSVDLHISNLRRKLGPAEDGSARIVTVRGGGYQLAARNRE
ncbi:Transcriptional regulatory protein CpxR [Candidatus Magnetaquicoccaceae bacterium FCR-1]|uniref:Transcriptional regulatory protein CpxR n=1 Tax=Candidatus Magnetaquiglobus chichijimensis TaxID=3141448 RepID=A0ABQ0C9F8_9PROT